MVDKKFNNESVLFSCMRNLKEYFSETQYIGEPLYITRIYDTLNDVDGVLTVKKVRVKNKSGGLHSFVRMDFDEAMSRDGTYIKTPKNVILELKFPNSDIKGTAI